MEDIDCLVDSGTENSNKLQNGFRRKIQLKMFTLEPMVDAALVSSDRR
jgi:hypothetical protein